MLLVLNEMFFFATLSFSYFFRAHFSLLSSKITKNPFFPFAIQHFALRYTDFSFFKLNLVQNSITIKCNKRETNGSIRGS